MSSEATGRRLRPHRENTLLALLRIRVFRRMWAAITFSSFGDWLGLLANTALAQQLTHHQSVATQGFAISGVMLVRLAPDLVFGPFAAAFSDKLDRRKTVIIGEVAAGVLYASIAVGYNLVWLYIAQFVIEAVGLFTQPAKQVIGVAIVPRELLATANQVSLISVYGTVPIASGVFALLSAGNRLVSGSATLSPTHVNVAIVVALLLDTVTYFVSASTVFLSRRDIPVVPADREKQQGIVSLLREGVAYVRGHSLIRGLYVGIIGAFAAGGLTVGVAQLWVETLSAGTAGYSIMFGTVFTGLAVGMLVGPRVLPAYTRSRVFGLAIGCAGVSLLVMSLVRDFILADLFASFVGLFAGMAWIIGYTLIGHEVEDRLRGRIFSFVLSSVRMMLLLTIAVGPILAGFFGSHSFKIGDHARLRFSGPGLTLLVGGVLALLVSYYATTRTTRSRAWLRDLLRRRVLHSGMGGQRAPQGHQGVFVSVDGVDPAVTARYAARVAEFVREEQWVVRETVEPTESPLGRRVAELLNASDGVEPETAALLSAADRAEHVASVIRPALDRGEVVVCDRYLLTSLALHGGGLGADVERIRSVNAWSTGELTPDLVLVVVPAATEASDAAVHTLRDAVEADPARFVPCPPDSATSLPEVALARLRQLLATRASLLARADPAAGDVAAR